MGRLLVIGQCKVSQKNRGPEPEDEGGDGVLIDRGTEVKACYRFSYRIKAVVADDSHFIE